MFSRFAFLKTSKSRKLNIIYVQNFFSKIRISEKFWNFWSRLRNSFDFRGKYLPLDENLIDPLNEKILVNNSESLAFNDDFENQFNIDNINFHENLIDPLQGIPSQTGKSNLALREGRKDISDIPWQFFSRKTLAHFYIWAFFIKTKWEIMKNHKNY